MAYRRFLYVVSPPARDTQKSGSLFSGEKTPSKADAYRLIDEKRGMTYFHLKINFHPKWEDTRKDLDLRTITSQTIATLKRIFPPTLSRLSCITLEEH
jgi:hypothetical protein